MTEREQQYPVSGAGLGLRRGLMNKLMAEPPDEVDFMEVAPENWIHVGGRLGNKFRFFTERYPFLIHGLSLSIGAPSPLNETLLRQRGVGRGLSDDRPKRGSIKLDPVDKKFSCLGKLGPVFGIQIYPSVMVGLHQGENDNDEVMEG